MIEIKKNDKILVLVAHPDDETIWMGGTILLNPQASWTIFSLCRAHDADRAPKFKKVCDYYGAQSIITDLDDESDLDFDVLVKQTKEIVKSKLQNKGFDYIFVHGENGEYGHDRHIVVHEAFKSLFEDGYLQAKKVLFFHYKKKNEEEDFSEIVSGDNPDFILNLDEKIYKKKKIDVMSNIYGFDPEGIDARYCTNPECFKIL